MNKTLAWIKYCTLSPGCSMVWYFWKKRTISSKSKWFFTFLENFSISACNPSRLSLKSFMTKGLSKRNYLIWISCMEPFPFLSIWEKKNSYMTLSSWSFLVLVTHFYVVSVCLLNSDSTLNCSSCRIRNLDWYNQCVTFSSSNISWIGVCISYASKLQLIAFTTPLVLAYLKPLLI